MVGYTVLTCPLCGRECPIPDGQSSEGALLGEVGRHLRSAHALSGLRVALLAQRAVGDTVTVPLSGVGGFPGTASTPALDWDHYGLRQRASKADGTTTA